MTQDIVTNNQFSYRVRQFTAALHAQVTPAELAEVAAQLSPAELGLFRAMARYDQRHCFDVYGTLRGAGYQDPLLLRAALIHDCGKCDDLGRPLALPWYVVATVLKRFPALYLFAARLFAPIRYYAEHAWRGAALVAAAGSPPEMVTTIRHYHDPQPAGPAALLQWADEQH
ncbi:MAG: hypothetical protein HC822_17545 [Oscillochloris sp.]|nr:hypothetical protein [Oscillochloris sp.]